MLDSTVTYAQTTTGDMIAIADATGENVATAMADQATKNKADQIIKNAARAKNAFDKSKNGSGGNDNDNKQKPESKAGASEPYTYENGEYSDAGYHKPEDTFKSNSKPSDSRRVKSPSPKDGQKALDNSYGIEDCEHRASVEDGKYVVLYRTDKGTFHGFVCDQWSDVPRKIQSIFKEHELVHSKSGELLKKLRN